MFHIIPNILTLVQAKYHLLEEKVDKCEHCNKLNPWKHGMRTRKSDRESPSAESLNPINIQRYYCTGCKKTFSSIPECISPRRWYSWIAQQVVLRLIILGKSHYAIAKQCKPSYKTIKRWFARADDQRKCHKDALGTFEKYTSLNRTSGFNDFWGKCLSIMTLGAAMRLCHETGIIIP